MKKTKLIHVKVIDINRRRNSVNGNPRYDVTLCDDNACKMYFATTQSDAMCGYAIHSGMIGKRLDVTIHFTAKGTPIIEYINNEY